MVVRELRRTDLGAIRCLLQQLGYEVSADVLKRRVKSVLERENHRLFVADDQGKAVGFIHVLERPSLDKGIEAVIQAMVVDSGSRRRGVGRALMGEAEKWASARDLGVISLYTRADRADAHAYYQRSGFQNVATVSLMRKDTAQGRVRHMAATATKSLHNDEVDRCVDIVRHADGTFGFKEFRRDPEDRGGWTLVGYNPQRVYATEQEAIDAAKAAVAWLRETPEP